MAQVYETADPEIQLHNLSNRDFVHDDYDHARCACSRIAAQPVRPAAMSDGGVCFSCGGMTVRTGTCTTCTSCGTTGGCG